MVSREHLHLLGVPTAAHAAQPTGMRSGGVAFVFFLRAWTLTIRAAVRRLVSRFAYTGCSARRSVASCALVEVATFKPMAHRSRSSCWSCARMPTNDPRVISAADRAD